MPIKFEYAPLFEELWSTHPVGTKKLAYDLWVKMAPTKSENDQLIAYLERRQRLDRGWVVEKKVHHLRTILYQRQWENEDYKRISTYKPTAAAHADFAPEAPRAPANPAIAAQALAESKRMVRH